MLETATPVKWALRLVAVSYVFFLVAWPVTQVVRHTFANGLTNLTDALTDDRIIGSLQLTVMIAIWAVVINLVFGVTISLLLVRQEFPGKRVLSALIDLPMSVSPVVVGLALVLVYNGRDGWFGPTAESAGFKIIFDSPGMIMATCFVALPLVVREVVPVPARGRATTRSKLPAAWVRTIPRRSGGSPCQASSGPSCTASSSASPGRSVSSAR